MRRAIKCFRLSTSRVLDARTEGKKIVNSYGLRCECGLPLLHEHGASFYTSVQDAGKTGLLSGPYSTHQHALNALLEDKGEAQLLNYRALFYAFGTVAMPGTYRKPGVLDRYRAELTLYLSKGE